ncbi:MAG: DUF305 domain-containing protein [Anaerolineae bacterium]|nr:DUF305 domain-containing protein [Anaerolineae bacterium]
MKSMSTSRLLLMAAAHFVVMYVMMYAMVNTFSNIFPNLNQFYMAGIMTAPMLIMEVILMRSMYENKRALWVIFGSSVIVLVAFFIFIRQQTGITDREFLRSMIPHHAGAILMCEQAPIQDSEIRTLCESIIASQQSEIDQMKTILDRLG